MAKITKTEEQLTKELEVAMKKLYKTLPGTSEEKIQILRTKFESEIQQLIQPKQIEKISKKKEKPETSEEMKAIIDLLRQLRPYAEIVEKYGKTCSNISHIARRRGIYSPKAVRQELKKPEVAEMSNEELAEKTGVYPEAIERVRKELEQEEQKRKAKNSKKGKAEEIEAILELLKQLRPHVEIAKQYGKAQSNISRLAEKNGIYSPRAVRQELKKPKVEEMSNEELAEKTGAYPEAIARIREELKKDKEKAEQLSNEATEQQSEPIEEQRQEKNEEAESAESLQQSKRDEENPSKKVVSDKQEKGSLPEEQSSQETEKELIIEQIVNHGKAGMEISEIEKRTGMPEEIVNSILSRNGIWSPAKIREKLEQPGAERMPNAIWAKWAGVYPETIARIREEVEKDKKKAEQLSSGTIEQQAEPAEEQQEKGEEVQSTESLQEPKRRKEEVPPQKTVSDEQENGSLLGEQSSQEKQNETLTKHMIIVQQVVKCGRLGIEIPEIARRAGLSTGSASQILRKNNIWSADKIRKELRQSGAEKRSNASWASLAGVDVEAIVRIKEELKKDKEKAEQLSSRTIEQQPEPIEEQQQEKSEEVKENEMQREMPHASCRERLSVSRSGRLQITRESDDTESGAEAASPVITYQAKAQEYSKDEQELAKKLGISVDLTRTIKSKLSTFPAVAAIAKEYKVSRKVVEEISKIVKQESYDRTHTVVQYRIKMMQLRSEVKQEIKDKIRAGVLEHRVDILATEFTPFLTQEDYAFLAYGYVKSRAYQKAVDLGEQHLQLETPSLSSLQQRIREVIQKGLEEKGKTQDFATLKFDIEGDVR